MAAEDKQFKVEQGEAGCSQAGASSNHVPELPRPAGDMQTNLYTFSCVFSGSQSLSTCVSKRPSAVKQLLGHSDLQAEPTGEGRWSHRQFKMLPETKT